MIFPSIELFLVIFHVFHDFQSMCYILKLWWNTHTRMHAHTHRWYNYTKISSCIKKADKSKQTRSTGQWIGLMTNNLTENNCWEWQRFICLIWLFTSHQQYFSYKGTGLPGLNQYQARINVLAQRHNAMTPVRLEPMALRSRVKHSSTEPLHSLDKVLDKQKFSA